MYFVYILASRYRGTLYVGVTSDLAKRVWEHKNEVIAGFTKEYAVKTLVYIESHEDVNIAIAREKLIKKWRRSIKFEAIERQNPEWNDLYETLNY